MDAIVLAGGKGTRLQKILPDIPKPLAPINKIPFLDFIISFLQSQKEINKIIITVGYKKELIINRYKNFPNIVFCEEGFPLGTGGAIKKAFSLADSENILALNGDSYVEYSLLEFLNFHLSKQADISILSVYQTDLFRFGKLIFDKHTKKISAFSEKPNAKNGYINSGVYLMKKDVFDFLILPDSFSIETFFFPMVIETKNIFAYEISTPFIDIGTESSYLQAQNIFSFISQA